MLNFFDLMSLNDLAVQFMFWGFLFIVVLFAYFLVRSYESKVDKQMMAIGALLGQDTSSAISGLQGMKTKHTPLNRLRLALIDSCRTIEHLNQMHQQSLKVSVEEQKEFTSVFAHEVRTPLNVLLGQVRKAKSQDIESNVPALDFIESSANKLNKIIQAALDYQLFKQGVSTSQIDEFQLTDLKRKLSHHLEPGQRERVIICASESSPVTLEADETRIFKILSNLVDNALKFSPKDKKVIVDMHYQMKAGTTYLTLAVLDRGIGISQAERETIFQHFYQVGRGLNRTHEGTGMGLTITKRLVESLGGQITVVSQMNVSTRFDVTIPIQTKGPKADAQVNPAGGASEKEKFGKRVLMVEDNDLNTLVAVEFLKANFGCTLTSVKSGEAAIELFGKNMNFDVILMDINLGEGLNGLETTSIMKTRWPDSCPPIFALTASALSMKSDVARSTGLEQVLNKPLEVEAFAQAWERFQRVKRAMAPT